MMMVMMIDNDDNWNDACGGNGELAVTDVDNVANEDNFVTVANIGYDDDWKDGGDCMNSVNYSESGIIVVMMIVVIWWLCFVCAYNYYDWIQSSSTRPKIESHLTQCSS